MLFRFEFKLMSEPILFRLGRMLSFMWCWFAIGLSKIEELPASALVYRVFGIKLFYLL